VEEILRYDGPVQLTARHLLKDAEVSGRRIAKGESVILLLAAANRDPDQFQEPDLLDITRPDANRHLAFGNGIHFCLGAPLARVEAQAAVASILRRLDDLELVEEKPPYTDNFTLRGLARLPVRFRPAS
jgi:pimeloyl-[acyl-carrier protein] synthase